MVATSGASSELPTMAAVTLPNSIHSVIKRELSHMIFQHLYGFPASSMSTEDLYALDMALGFDSANVPSRTLVLYGYELARFEHLIDILNQTFSGWSDNLDPRVRPVIGRMLQDLAHLLQAETDGVDVSASRPILTNG